jgi:8-oxo-dGTP pyrophosphatase MutT (NUDIX family)
VLSSARTAYRFVFRPRTRGVKCVVEHDGRWLMIRNTYGHKYWTLPGGGVKRRESPADAARREVGEEVGVTLHDIEPIGQYFSRRHYSKDTVYCFRARVDSADHRIDGKEILEAKWIAPDAIPGSHGAAVDEILQMLETTP